MDEVIELIEERIEEIESDNRYPSGDEPFEEVKVNAYLALMQAEWRGELKGLKMVRGLLEK